MIKHNTTLNCPFCGSPECAANCDEVRPIPDYPGYLASKSGIIYSEKYRNTNRIKALKTYCNRGYLKVRVSVNGKAKTPTVHKLVLLAFVGKPKENMQGCHNNGNRKDNRLENLRWDTAFENNQDKIRHGTTIKAKGELNNNSKLKPQDILDIRWLTLMGIKQKEIAEMFNLHNGYISLILTRRRWKHI